MNFFENIRKKRFLRKHGWEPYSSRGNFWVKTEWLNEPTTLNCEPHLCPNWYHVESLDNAYKIAIEENEILNTENK